MPASVQRDLCRSRYSIPLSDRMKLGLACLVVGTIVAWINRYHDLQSGIYHGRYLELARFFRGEAEQPIITYPLWGYPWLLSWLPYPESTSIALQLLLGVVALVLVYTNAASVLPLRGPLALLCVIAVPWYALASVKLADIYAASLSIMAICLLARAVKTQQLRWNIASGLLSGASLNFRSDFLTILGALLVLTVTLAPSMALCHWRRLLSVIAIAVVLVVPWGIFRVYHGKSFGITSTNAGMMLYNSLGFPGNTWGIVSDDARRSQEIKEVLGREIDPASEQGNAFFRQRFLAAVISNPREFCRKVTYNLAAVLKLGFYSIEVWTLLSEEEQLHFMVLKEQLKWLAGARPYLPRIEEFRERGLWDEGFSLASVPLRQWMIVLPSILITGLSALYLLGLLLAVVGIVCFDRSRLREPILLFCITGTISVFSLLGLTQYEPRQANLLYLLGIPLIGVLLEWCARAIGTRRQRRMEQRQ